MSNLTPLVVFADFLCLTFLLGGRGTSLQHIIPTTKCFEAQNLPAMRETWVGKIPWRRQRLHTPVFWPGEFHGLQSPWGYKESDTTERSLSLSNVFEDEQILRLRRNQTRMLKMLLQNRRIFKLEWEVEEIFPPGVPSGQERRPNLPMHTKQRFIKHLLST